MRTPNSKGQYRKVRYADDGCYIYQCLWCLGTIAIHDNPHYGWNFCPKCGKSWFKRLECRDHEVPRWYYDRWGNGDSPDAPDLWRFYKRPESTATWYIECRVKWPNRPWDEWKHEYSCDKDPCNPDWQWAKSALSMCRARHDPDEETGFDLKFEYRARLERKKNLTFVIPGVDSSVVRNLSTRETP